MANKTEPIIVAVAPNGAYKSKKDHKAIPLNPEEIGKVAAECMAAGASMIHLHVRDSELRHSLDYRLYAKATEAIRKFCGDDFLIQTTTELASRYNARQQTRAILSLESDFISLAVQEAVGEGNRDDLQRLELLFKHISKTNMAVQIILYSAADFEILNRLVELNLIEKDRYTLLFVLGRYHQKTGSQPDDLQPFIEKMEKSTTWMICAFGQLELQCLLQAARQGGHVRSGFENNLTRPDGSVFSGNVESIELISESLRAEGRTIADTCQARTILLPKCSVDKATQNTKLSV